ncbi:Hypothetical protein CINCED_3A016682 [Cinara cedri]|uniref:Uncharacterized protein n=1 Tax=Cinara cedri TaxID=506608 RepID=A0A5E4NFI7_9HEMI|nr:Hypothetical protein CINCED_3A016682 [Cinara cedri]
MSRRRPTAGDARKRTVKKQWRRPRAGRPRSATAQVKRGLGERPHEYNIMLGNIPWVQPTASRVEADYAHEFT